ncbi:MAG: DUF2271 domain-containing protein [Comamonas sp.]|jgi:hypothetical protein|uniref:DUF2271 domain-containing protein n=1 Tax=Comamonas sp. TaxID=34028 RepID=UPI002818FDCC|nr:DUF2271 domain-containing protein [Comamonas sp.]MDR0213890.1 DUF2271 domain-containing protein [Comamonas sp.]MDR2298679.1 DUF2271 domain-containing protein [Comamonas sp.]
MAKRIFKTSVALSAVVGLPAIAGGLDVTVTVPQLQVAEYHKPYVAVWLEKAEGGVAANLSVWYDVKKHDAEGTKWLKDMRQWWRRTGRELSFPIDGVTQPTKPAGAHALSFAEGKNPLPKLAPGQYKLMVEAAREVGGRELVSIPFEWPAKSATSLSATGKTELGAIKLNVTP